MIVIIDSEEWFNGRWSKTAICEADVVGIYFPDKDRVEVIKCRDRVTEIGMPLGNFCTEFMKEAQ